MADFGLCGPRNARVEPGTVPTCSATPPPRPARTLEAFAREYEQELGA